MKHTGWSTLATLILTSLGVTLAPAPARAAAWQEEPPAEAGEAGGGDEAEEAEEEDGDDWMVITGGDVYTVTRGVLHGATVVIKNSRLHAIGHDVEIPEDADHLDATGLRVYPGLIACDSRGLVGNEPPQDTTDVFSLNLTLGLASGLTTVVTGNSAAKLTYGTLDGILLRPNLFQRVSVRGGAAWAKFHDDMDKVRKFRRKKADHDRDKAAGVEVGEEPKPQGLNQAYLQLQSGEAVARFDLSSALDLRRAARACQEFGFKAVVFGATEGWVVADELGRAGVACVVSPRTTRQEDLDSNQPNGPRPENAAMLYEGGVPVAVQPGSGGISLNGLVGRDLLTLPVEAAYAIRGGLSRQAALESITITAARALGIDDHVGSLEVGKDADLILTDGDVLHYQTLVQYAIVNGRMVYNKAEESLLSHIRPLDGDSRWQPAELLKALEEVHPAEEGTEEKADEAGADESKATEEKKDEGGDGGP